MTEHEFDDLVRQIGDEILARLGRAPTPPRPPAASSCACEEALVTGDPESATAALWSPSEESVAGFIDHTQLRPDATESEIAQLCEEARCYEFWSVCVHPGRVAQAVRELRGSNVKVAAVVGFPHGATVTPVKCAEAEQVLKLGARELDMVINIGALRSGDLDLVCSEVRSVVELAHRAGALVKIILETGLLNRKQKMTGCVVAKLAGADFVKTSTGFGPSGAEPQDVALMRQVVGSEIGVKAAGGIRTFRRMAEMMASGATRIGASASVEIVKQAALERKAATA